MRDDETPELEPELRDALGLVDLTDEGPPATLRAQTLSAVRGVSQHEAEPTAVGERASTDRVGHARVTPRRWRTTRRWQWPLAGGLALAAATVAVIVVGLGGNVAETRELALTGPGGTWTARVSQDAITIRGRGTPVSPSTRYELWAVSGPTTKPTLTSLGTFRPDGQGTIDAELATEGGLPDGASLAVTRETDADPKPNLPPILSSTSA